MESGTPATASIDQTPIAKERLYAPANGTPYWTVVMPANVINAALEQEFNTLAEQWRSETRHMSLAADKAANFHLHQIIGMGDKVLPLILQELQTKTTDWFWALRAIARQRAPAIPAEDQGVVRRIADIWIQWGRDNGYLRS